MPALPGHATDFSIQRASLASQKLTVNFNLVLSIDGYFMTLVVNLSYRLKRPFVVLCMTCSNRLSCLQLFI